MEADFQNNSEPLGSAIPPSQPNPGPTTIVLLWRDEHSTVNFVKIQQRTILLCSHLLLTSTVYDLQLNWHTKKRKKKRKEKKKRKRERKKQDQYLTFPRLASGLHQGDRRPAELWGGVYHEGRSLKWLSVNQLLHWSICRRRSTTWHDAKSPDLVVDSWMMTVQHW